MSPLIADKPGVKDRMWSHSTGIEWLQMQGRAVNLISEGTSQR